MVAFGFLHGLQNIWPLSLFKYDDLRESDELVRKLSLPESTKNFVFGIRVPEHESVIYILSVQNLSERSARDAEFIIREIRPDAVIAQVDNSAAAEIQPEECGLGEGLSDVVPTSVLEVLKRSFVEKVNKEKYENVAADLVLREIFGTSFNGHFLAAEKVAKEVGSSFMVLESPFVKISTADDSYGKIEAGSKFQSLGSRLIPQTASSAVLTSSRRFAINNDVQLQMLKLLSQHFDLLHTELNQASLSDGGQNETQNLDNYEIPPFGQSIYPLLLDLHDVFPDLPFVGRALSDARKMLSDVNKGEVPDSRVVSEVCIFRIAVEGLRIALNNAGRLPIKRTRYQNPAEFDFSQLLLEDKSHALLADVLKSQAKKFKTIVAIVDASSLAGLRKHWNTGIPPEVNDLVGHLLPNCDNDENTPNTSKLKRLLSDKPVVAVGAGASAILCASSLSKAVPASTFMKVAMFKVPASVNLFMTQTHRIMAFALSKVLGPSKVMAPGFATSGAKSASVLKISISAEKIRAVTHGIIASAEKTSFSAMRTAFYEIMRKRRARPIGFLPLATFGCSVATCAGLVVYGDGIECAAESLPSAPSIASLGRGIQNLRQVSQEVRQAEGNRIQSSIESLMYRLKRVKLQ